MNTEVLTLEIVKSAEPQEVDYQEILGAHQILVYGETHKLTEPLIEFSRLLPTLAQNGFNFMGLDGVPVSMDYGKGENPLDYIRRTWVSIGSSETDQLMGGIIYRAQELGIHVTGIDVVVAAHLIEMQERSFEMVNAATKAMENLTIFTHYMVEGEKPETSEEVKAIMGDLPMQSIFDKLQAELREKMEILNNLPTYLEERILSSRDEKFASSTLQYLEQNGGKGVLYVGRKHIDPRSNSTSSLLREAGFSTVSIVISTPTDIDHEMNGLIKERGLEETRFMMRLDEHTWMVHVPIKR